MSSLSQQCYEMIETKILSGEYGPGEKLGMERLKQDLGVGLSPIREALSKMVSSGLVVLDKNKGFSVVRLTQKSVRDLSLTYALIETIALEQAIKNGGEEWEANIAAKYYRLAKMELSDGPISWAEWLPLNTAFHKALVEGCGSPALMEIRDSLITRLQLYFRMLFALPDWVEVNHQEHKDLADAVMARDFENTSRIMKQHILSSLDDTIHKLNLPEE